MDNNVEDKNNLNKKAETLTLKKYLKEGLIEFTISSLRFFKMPDKLSNYIIKSIHFALPILFIYNVYFLDPAIVFIYLLQLLGTTYGFLYFKGCILSNIEYKLSGDDTNIVDPALIIMNVDVNRQNRYKISIIIMIAYLSLITYIVYKRKIFSDTTFFYLLWSNLLFGGLVYFFF